MSIDQRESHYIGDVAVASGASVSSAIAVPAGVSSMLVELPTISSASVKLTVTHGATGSTYRDLYDVNNTLQGRTTAGTGGIFQPFVLYGRPTFAKVAFSAAQTAARTLTVSFKA